MARALSKSGFYHVCQRGAARQDLFLDNAMRYSFLDLLVCSSRRYGIKIIAWCLMDNHIHLVVEDAQNHLSEMMRSVTAPFAKAFNKRTGGAGRVFQGAYESFPIEDEAYLLQVVQYVHNNPAEAGTCAAEQYFWSSYHEYVGETRIADTGLVLEMLGGVEGFRTFQREG